MMFHVLEVPSYRKIDGERGAFFYIYISNAYVINQQFAVCKIWYEKVLYDLKQSQLLPITSLPIYANLVQLQYMFLSFLLLHFRLGQLIFCDKQMKTNLTNNCKEGFLLGICQLAT